MSLCDVILCDACMQTRALYAPFESDLRSSSSDVYYHEMPGGQYTNLKFQVSLYPTAAPALQQTVTTERSWGYQRAQHHIIQALQYAGKFTCACGVKLWKEHQHSFAPR